MRLMLVSRVVAQHRPGGMPHVASDRAEALASEGHEVHLATTSPGPRAGPVSATVRSELGERITLWHLSAPAHEWSGDFARGCLNLARDLQPDAVHLDSFWRDAPWWRDLPRSTVKAVTMHGFGWGGMLTRWNLYRAVGGRIPDADFRGMYAEAEALRGFDAVIGVSRHEWRMLRDEYGLKQARLVYNPLPEYFFDPPATPPVRSGFLCAAVSQGGTRGFDLARRAADAAGVELRIASGVDRRDMPALYDAARAVVLPTSFGTGFDLAVCEARARGCPAIMSATGSYLSERQPWDSLVEQGDADGLTAALREFADPVVPSGAADAHRPGQHARAWVDAVFGVDGRV